MSFFDSAFDLIVGAEGGYVADPADPGGETKFGISKRAYPNVDIQQLTLEQAKGIYRRDYWDRLGCEAMSWERALCIFDAAVNQGPGFANGLPADPIDIAVARAQRYVSNAQFERFGKGWLRRLFTIFKAAQKTP